MASTRLTPYTVGLTLDWQGAWANGELGYEPSDEEIALLQDARRRPDYYMSGPPPKSTSRTPGRSRNDRLYRLPYTIV